MWREGSILRRDIQTGKCAIRFAGKGCEPEGRMYASPKYARESGVGEEAEAANSDRN